MARITWQALERHTLLLLNKINTEDPSAAETLITGTSALTLANLNDEAFGLAKMRWNIVLAHQGGIALICKTEGHPRRVEYRKTADIVHGQIVPSSLGPRSFTWKDPSAPSDQAKRKTLQRRQASVIDELRADPTSLRGVAARYYDLRGSLFVCSVDDTIEVEYYDAEMVANHFSELAALFNAETDFADIADEFVSPVCNVAAGLTALTLAGMAVAGQFFETARAEYEAQGLSVPEADYQAWMRPQNQ